MNFHGSVAARPEPEPTIAASSSESESDAEDAVSMILPTWFTEEVDLNQEVKANHSRRADVARGVTQK